VTARPDIVVLAVADVARAVGFYRASFGWTVVVDVGVYVELATHGSTRVALYHRDGFAKNTVRSPVVVPPGEIAPVELYLRVDDLAVAVERVQRAGGRALSPASARPWGEDVAYFADPDGNVIALAAPSP
jgi:predicted enzyme related to lactoylglutathione lyase